MQKPTYLTDWSPEKGAKILLTVENFDYASYSENSVWTVEDIIGAVGGVFAIWLGIDVKRSIELLGSAIYLLYSFVVTCCRKDDDSEDDNSEIQNASDGEFRHQTTVVVPRD